MRSITATSASAASLSASADRVARERVAAARALLEHPILTIAGYPDELALVRRHYAALRSTFATLLGYTLVMDSSFARLAKGPVSPDAPPRPARRGDGREFSSLMYMHLSLLCAALLSPHTGEQILISALIDQVRADAANIGVQVGDTLEERRALVAALGQLVAWGVLTETEGTAAGWGERRDEVLLTVYRPLLPQLLARRLSDCATPAHVLAGGLVEEPRKSLRRKLVENPLVRREDLTTAERDVLSRERTEQARLLAEHLGLLLEVRAEGALAYDPDTVTGGSDVIFPGRGTVAWATLLLCSELCDRLEPEAGSTVTLTDGRLVAGVFASLETVGQVLSELAQQYGRAWGSVYRESPARLLAEVIDFAEEMSVARRVMLTVEPPEPTAAGAGNVTDGSDTGRRTDADTVGNLDDGAEPRPDLEPTEVVGIVLHPVVGRYRPLPSTAAPTRAQRRQTTSGSTDSAEQDGLFDTTGGAR